MLVSCRPRSPPPPRPTRGDRPEHAADLSGVVNTNGQLCGALGVAAASTTYLGLPLGPNTSFAVVLGGFTVLALTASVAAAGTGRA